MLNDVELEFRFIFLTGFQIQVKQRMLYSSSVRALKTRLPGIHIEMQCNDDSDLAQSNLLQRCLERGYD